jgi:hypothetical protein
MASYNASEQNGREKGIKRHPISQESTLSLSGLLQGAEDHLIGSFLKHWWLI